MDAAERLAIVDLLTGIGHMVPNAGAPLTLLTPVETWVDVARTAVGGAGLSSAAINEFGDIADHREPTSGVVSLSPVAEDGQLLRISMEFAVVTRATEP